jgi:hypothetical protein
MLTSQNPEWVARATSNAPVEGASEIDIAFEHEQLLVYAEAKLGSDVSMRTTFDPQRNQIVRNIDCLLDNAGDREAAFWMVVKDDEPSRAYVQLMKSYKADSNLLKEQLPHCDPKRLESIAQNLVVLLWSDFDSLLSAEGADEEALAVKRELKRRIAV